MALIFLNCRPAIAAVFDVSNGDYTNIHTVAVISAIGDHVSLRNDHFLASKTKQLNIQDWNIDADVESRLRQYLSGKFTFKDILYDRSALADIPNGPLDTSTKFGDFLRTVTGDGVDAYIVVRPDLEYQAPGMEGIALENGDFPIIWANYEIDIVDAKSTKIISKAYSRIQLRAHTSPSFSGLPAPVALKLKDDLELNASQMLLLRASILTTVNVSLVETVRALNMGVDLPPPGARTLIQIPPDKDPYKAYKNVAVVSALGSSIVLHHIGGTIFSQEDYLVPEPDWKIDSLIEDRARADLGKHFTIVEPDVDRDAFAGATMWDDDGKVAPNFPGLHPDPRVDLYVVFLKLNSSTLMYNVKTKGVGVFNRRPITDEPEVTLAFAHYAVVAIDAHDMKYIFAHKAVLGPSHANADPYEDIGNANWPASPPALTDDQSQAIHDKIVRLLNESIDETLLQMALLGAVPVSGGPPASTARQ